MAADDLTDPAPAPTRTDAPPEGAIVIGLDGSDKDDAALEWAAGAAARSGRALHLVHAIDLGSDLALLGPIGGGLLTEVVGDEAGVPTRALARVLGSHPGIAVTHSEPLQRAEQALIEASRTAYLVVVGSQKRSGLSRFFLGHTALSTAMHADCPVVVCREQQAPVEGPVVVGVDGSDVSRFAAEKAFHVAQTRGTSVLALISWNVEFVDGAVVTTPGTPAWEQVEARYRAVAEKVVGPLRVAHPDVPCAIEVRRGGPNRVLEEASESAGLLVLGTRGHGGLSGMLLGSVSARMLEVSLCPVMLVSQRIAGAARG